MANFQIVNGSLRAIAYGNNTYVAVGTVGIIKTFADGTTWASRTSGTTTDYFHRTVYGNGIGVTYRLLNQYGNNIER
jgi:hypothetical protein